MCDIPPPLAPEEERRPLKEKPAVGQAARHDVLDADLLRLDFAQANYNESRPSHPNARHREKWLGRISDI